MPISAVALRLKKFRRRFGITASRVVVRSHLSWQWVGLAGLLLSALLTAVIWQVLQSNEAGIIGREVEDLRRQILEQRDELELLRSTADTGKNEASIERASQQQLLAKLEGLERENGALKEDILVFERLIPVVGEQAAVRIESFRVLPETGARFRYRLLLAFQPTKKIPEFHGHFQLAVSFMLAGKGKQMVFPEKQAAIGEYQLELKRFLRRESVFELPPGAELKAVEVRVLQGGTLRSKRLAQF